MMVGTKVFLPPGPPIATQAQQEAGTEAGAFVAPSIQHFHPSAAKAWVKFTWAAGVPTASASYNISSMTDTTTGDTNANFTVNLSTTNYCIVCAVETFADMISAICATTHMRLRHVNNSGSAVDDATGNFAAAFGDI